MIEMHSKYDKMHTNRIVNALNYINNNVNSCINCMLSHILQKKIDMVLLEGFIESFDCKNV